MMQRKGIASGRVKMVMAIIVVAAVVLMGTALNVRVQPLSASKLQTYSPEASSTNNTSAIVNSSSTLNIGEVTSTLLGSLNYFSPVESYYFSSMLYVPFAAYEFPPLPYLKPMLAEGWTHNANYTVWNLTLKKGLKWDNGSPLNSTDLWYSLEQYQLAGSLGGLNVVGITKVNSTTVQVTTSTPEPNFMFLWVTYTNSYIVPYQTFHLYDNTTTGLVNGTFQNFKNIVADGPFVITNYTAGENPIIFHANKYYFQGPPHMKTLVVRIYSSLASEVEAYRAGLEDAVWDMGAYSIVVPLLKGLPNTNLYSISPGPYEGIWLNMYQWPYNTTQFRMALAYLTNRTELNDAVNTPNGTMVGFNGLIPSLDQQVGINPSSVNNYPYNPTLAQSLLGQIGIKMDNTSGTANYGLYVYDNPSLPDYGTPVTINISTTQLGFGDIATAVLLEQLWQSAGFKVSVTSMAPGPFFSTLYSSTGWDVAVSIDATGYYPSALTNAGAMIFEDAPVGANFNSSFGMANWNASKLSKLANESYLYPEGSNQSNAYVVQEANYIDSFVPVIPLWVNYNVESVKTNYYWGNQTQHTGLFSTQALVQPQFWYGALYVVHPLTSTVSTPSAISPIVYAGVGVIVVLIVAGIVAVAYRSRKRRQKEEK